MAGLRLTDRVGGLKGLEMKSRDEVEGWCHRKRKKSSWSPLSYRCHLDLRVHLGWKAEMDSGMQWPESLLLFSRWRLDYVVCILFIPSKALVLLCISIEWNAAVYRRAPTLEDIVFVFLSFGLVDPTVSFWFGTSLQEGGFYTLGEIERRKKKGANTKPSITAGQTD